MEGLEAPWKDLGSFFHDNGFTLYDHFCFNMLTAPAGEFSPSGFMYTTVWRAFTEDDPGSISMMFHYQYSVSSVHIYLFLILLFISYYRTP